MRLPSLREVLLGVTVAAALGVFVFWEELPLVRHVPPHFTSIPASDFAPTWSVPDRLLPYAYWQHRRQYPDNYRQISCSELPQPEDLRYATAAWQRLAVPNGTVYAYGAYWDDRFKEPLVRVLIYCDVTPLPPLVCQFWYEDENAPESVPATQTYGWQPAWGGPTDSVNEPYLLACGARRRPPDPQRAPVALSLTVPDELCGKPSTLLAVQGVPETNEPLPPPDPGSICVCLKWLQFHLDISAELIEWIEFLKVFGATKLFVFIVKAHPNTRRVLAYYERAGFADVTPFAHAPHLREKFSGGYRDFLDYRRELLPLNDCMLRARRAGFAWLAALDSDEIIVPHKYVTWQQVLEAETSASTGMDAFAFSNYYFLDSAQRDIAAPPHMKILGHRWRARLPNPPGHNVKSFHNTSSVVAMHNHYPLSCGARSCNHHNVNDSVARLHHYRVRCGDGKEDCAARRDIVRDDTLARWAYVATRVRRVLRDIKLTHDYGYDTEEQKTETTTEPTTENITETTTTSL